MNYKKKPKRRTAKYEHMSNGKGKGAKTVS